MVAAADAAFAADLYGRVAASPGNVVVSPSSVEAVLQMATIGARGATAVQLRHVLHLADRSDAQIVTAAAAVRQSTLDLTDASAGGELRISDRLWLDRVFAASATFVDELRAGWGSPPDRLDFHGDSDAARRDINAAVTSETNGKITGLLAPDAVDSNTKFMLTDAVYLDADWAAKFNVSSTMPGPFTTADGQSKMTPLMHQTTQLGYVRGAGFQTVQLAYAGDRLVMTIVLPDAALAPVEQQLAARGLASFTAGVRPTEVALTLPRFHAPATSALRAPLTALGMTEPFGPAADFGGIATGGGLSLTAAVQSAAVTVDEDGTQAVAATALGGGTSAIQVPPPARVTVTVDRPFLFVISDVRSGVPIFLGRIDDPSATA